MNVCTLNDLMIHVRVGHACMCVRVHAGLLHVQCNSVADKYVGEVEVN